LILTGKGDRFNRMPHDPQHRSRQGRRAAIGGWILFIVCALFFMAAAWRNQDLLTFIGSLVFLLACLFFLIPLLRPPPGGGPNAE
jgi:hypothetical protein